MEASSSAVQGGGGILKARKVRGSEPSGQVNLSEPMAAGEERAC